MSHVALEQAICPVCATKHDTGVLLDTSLREDAFEERAVTTHFEMCPEHKEMEEKNLIALVGVDLEQSEVSENDKITPEGAYRTGRVMHIDDGIAQQIFNVTITTSLVFVEDEVIDKLMQMYKAQTGIDLEEQDGQEDK